MSSTPWRWRNRSIVLANPSRSSIAGVQQNAGSSAGSRSWWTADVDPVSSRISSASGPRRCPGARRCGASRPSDTLVGQAGCAEALAVQHVAAVDDGGAIHDVSDLVGVQVCELGPFGQDDQDVGSQRSIDG